MIQKEALPVFDCVIDISEVHAIAFVLDEHGTLTVTGGLVRQADPLLIRQSPFLFFHLSDSRVMHNGYLAAHGDRMEPGDFCQIEDFHFYYQDRSLWTENREDLLIEGLSYENLPDRGTYPVFQRNTRLQTPVDEVPVEILDPSELPRRPEEHLALRLLPSLGMLAAAGFMASRGGTAMLLFSGIAAMTGVFTAVAGVLSGNRQYRRSLKERRDVYTRYIEEKRQELLNVRQREALLMRSQYPDMEELMKRLFRFSPDLFDRSRNDPDFLHLQIGTGTVRARKEVRFRDREQLEERDELQRLPEQIAAEFRWMPNMPVICDLKETGTLGVIGKEDDRYDLFRNMILDLILRQSYSDVQIILISDGEHAGRLHWLRMIPHTQLASGRIRGIAADRESRADILEYLYQELALRKETGIIISHLVVCICQDTGFREHPVSRFLPAGKELGVSFLFFADKREQLLQGCRKVIDIQSPNYAAILDTQNSRDCLFFSFPSLSEHRAEAAASMLAPVYTREVSLDHSLTSRYSLYQMLGIRKAEELDLKRSWEPKTRHHSLEAPLGISGTGVLSLDIHDRAHGPHGLVAGTTGSGKSELLQTYILSMALRYSPETVSFVIIDYKGGGLAGPFRTLPHLRGVITNMDGKEASRALRSIKSELLKRQKLFEAAHVKHIDQYPGSLPHLVIVIDEFAEMKAAHPDFMKELISAARIGRSLGVHLILATQKPSGQVSDQIWSNTRFRICLKVQDASDSNEMLHSPLASEIREPGRGYLQVGNQEIFVLFQSAYSSEPEEDIPETQKGFSIFQVSDTGKRVPVYHRKEVRHGHTATQMQAVVHHIENYCRQQGIQGLPAIFSPPLEPRIPYQPVSGKPDTGLKPDLGWLDDPDHQRRSIYAPDLVGQHLLIVGSSRSGKTNLLKVLIHDLARRYSTEELHIYMIDCASGQLKGLEGLPHVGGVVAASEQEKMENLFHMLKRELEHRKKILEATGSAILEEARRNKLTALPEILLVIDQLAALKELYFQDREDFRSLCNEGLSSGLHVVAASPQASALGYRYLSLFGERIALFNTDAGEYRYLFDRLSELPEEIPGRCILERSGIMYQCQIYQASEELCLRSGKAFSVKPGSLPGSIPMIPELLTESRMRSFAADDPHTPWRIPAGLSREEIEPVWIDLARTNVLYLSGREQGGRHNWVTCAVHELERYFAGQYRIYVADGYSRRLRWLKGRPGIEEYTTDPDRAVKMLLSIASQLSIRHQEICHREEAEDPWPLLLFLLDSPDTLERFGTDPKALETWKELTGRYKRLQVCVMILCVENEPISFNAPEPLRRLRDQGVCLFFDTLKNCRLFEMPYSRAGQKPEDFQPGDAWLLQNSERIRIRTPLAE